MRLVKKEGGGCKERTAFVQMNEYMQAQIHLYMQLLLYEYRSHDLVLHLAGGRGFQLCSVLWWEYNLNPDQSVLKRGEPKAF